MGCPDSVISDTLLRNHQENCLTSGSRRQPYNENLSLFRAPVVHLHGSTNLETPTSNVFNDFLEKSGCDPKRFCGVPMDKLSIVENIVNKCLYL